MRFNETWSRVARPAPALAAAAIVAAIALSTALLAAEPAGPAASLPAFERQGIARLRGAWWMGRGLHDNLWKDFDPNTIPVLLIERRPGRAPWALVSGVASAPAGFTLVLPAGADQPAIYAAKEFPLPAGATSPVLLGKESAAVYFNGETIKDTEFGSPATELVIPQIVHEMAHVYAVSKGMPADLVPKARPEFSPTPEVVAMTVMENRLLADFLYADSGKGSVLEELGRQFLAIRRARWALMGKAADYERRVEIFEAPAFFAQSQVMKLGAQKMIEPPPIQTQDPAFHAFQFGLLWRLSVLISHLVDTPLDADQMAARIPMAGAAQVMMMERLGVDWRAKVFKGDTSLPEILGARISMDPSQQEGALTAARAMYGFEPALALARERAGEGARNR